MGKEEIFDKSGVVDNLTGVEVKGAYDSDSNKVGTGVGSTPDEAADNARQDLEAQKMADQAQEYIKQNEEQQDS